MTAPIAAKYQSIPSHNSDQGGLPGYVDEKPKSNHTAVQISKSRDHTKRSVDSATEFGVLTFKNRRVSQESLDEAETMANALRVRGEKIWLQRNMLMKLAAPVPLTPELQSKIESSLKRVERQSSDNKETSTPSCTLWSGKWYIDWRQNENREPHPLSGISLFLQVEDKWVEYFTVDSTVPVDQIPAKAIRLSSVQGKSCTVLLPQIAPERFHERGILSVRAFQISCRDGTSLITAQSMVEGISALLRKKEVRDSDLLMSEASLQGGLGEESTSFSKLASREADFDSEWYLDYLHSQENSANLSKGIHLFIKQDGGFEDIGPICRVVEAEAEGAVFFPMQSGGCSQMLHTSSMNLSAASLNGMRADPAMQGCVDSSVSVFLVSVKRVLCRIALMKLAATPDANQSPEDQAVEQVGGGICDENHLRDLFQMLDLSGSGVLGEREFLVGLKVAGLKDKLEEGRQFLTADGEMTSPLPGGADTNTKSEGKGSTKGATITQEDFVRFVLQHQESYRSLVPAPLLMEMKARFLEMTDGNTAGTLTTKQLDVLVNKLGWNWSRGDKIYWLVDRPRGAGHHIKAEEVKRREAKGKWRNLKVAQMFKSQSSKAL